MKTLRIIFPLGALIFDLEVFFAQPVTPPTPSAAVAEIASKRYALRVTFVTPTEIIPGASSDEDLFVVNDRFHHSQLPPGLSAQQFELLIKPIPL
jgi:hypothetical protein